MKGEYRRLGMDTGTEDGYRGWRMNAKDGSSPAKATMFVCLPAVWRHNPARNAVVKHAVGYDGLFILHQSFPAVVPIFSF